MTQTDVNTFVGAYPFHEFGAWDAAALVRDMARSGSTSAWVSHLGAVYRRNARSANAALYAATAEQSQIRPVPALDSGLQDVDAALDEAVARGAPAVRSDPALCGLPPVDDAMRSLLAACAARQLPLMMAVRLEDVRQRQPEDPAADLAPWAVRHLIRSHPDARLIITHADRDFIEQVHFGSTPGEAARILWDISWIWGPPEDHLELLLTTVGAMRFAFGTGMPLRLPENSVAKLDLSNIDPATRERIATGNVAEFLRR